MKKCYGPLFALGLKNVFQKFEEIDGFEVNFGNGRTSIALMLVKDTVIELEKGTSSSVKKCCAGELPHFYTCL